MYVKILHGREAPSSLVRFSLLYCLNLVFNDMNILLYICVDADFPKLLQQYVYEYFEKFAFFFWFAY